MVEGLLDGRAQVEVGKMEAVPWADLEKPHETSSYSISFSRKCPQFNLKQHLKMHQSI